MNVLYPFLPVKPSIRMKEKVENCMFHMFHMFHQYFYYSLIQIETILEHIRKPFHRILYFLSNKFHLLFRRHFLLLLQRKNRLMECIKIHQYLQFLHFFFYLVHILLHILFHISHVLIMQLLTIL